jgi:hypothetical protein
MNTLGTTDGTEGPRRRGATTKELEARFGITLDEQAAAAAALRELEQDGQVWRGPVDASEEGRALLANPAFREALAAGAAQRPSGLRGPRPTAPNGRLLVRVARSVHQDLAARAIREGVSVNQLVAGYINRGLGQDEGRP